MTSGDDKLAARGTSHPLLSHRDWLYLLGLLVPFVAYDLALKWLLIVSWPKDLGLAENIMLMRSDLLFGLGYVLLWVCLFVMMRRGPFRPIFVGLFHVATIFVALISAVAYQYFAVTGSTLDSGFILYSLSSGGGLADVVTSEVTPGLLALILLVLAYAFVGPWLVARLVGRWRGWPEAVEAGTIGFPWLRVAGLGLLTCALFSFSLQPGGSGGIAAPSKSFSLDSFVNVAKTALENGGTLAYATEPPGPPPDASLVRAAEAEKRNVVLVHLESTRAQSVTPYNPGLETTPFMDELAEESLLAEQAYVVVPHTTNALATANCGVDPPLNPWQTSSLGDQAPAECLADLLKEQGYDTAWFTSSTAEFEIERLPELVSNLGYEEFYPLESMDTEGFEPANYFGYEDDIMLEPSRDWLTEQKRSGNPFIATYETITPHHQYLAPQERYGFEDFSEDELLNRYQNSVRYQDFFLKNLFDQYKELGLYEDTVFVLYGDHGEGFGEHGRYQHDNMIYEEGLRIPLLFHDPGRFENSERVTAPVSQLDILPTVANLLGYEVEGGDYKGSSLLLPLPKARTLMAGCWSESGCMASIKGTEKYIYHFEDMPEEIFDLSKDPGELNNLAGQYSPEELDERRRELLEWRSQVNATYGNRTSG